MAERVTATELQALACGDCIAKVTAHRGVGVAGPVLVVVVEHASTCPWAGQFVPVGGATLLKAGALLRHVRDGELDVLPGADTSPAESDS